MKSSSLTTKQQAFANALLEGVSPSESYKRSYDSHSNNAVIAVRACELKKHHGIQAYIRQQQAKLDRKKGLERDEKRRILAAIARDPDAAVSDRIKAIQLDSAMAGHNKPVKTDSFGLKELMAMVRSGSRPVGPVQR